MQAKLSPHPDQIRWYVQSAISGFDTLSTEDAIENAKHDLHRILEYLDAMDAADKAILIAGIAGIKPGVRLEAFVREGDALHKPDLINANPVTARHGLVVAKVDGVPMINARMVEEMIERQERAFQSLIRAIEDRGFEVHVDVDGMHTVEPRQ